MATAAALSDAPATYPSLAAALVAAQREAKSVAKGSKNDFHGYKYASAEAIMEEARNALNGAGLAVLMTGWTIACVDVEYTDIDKDSGVATLVKDQERTATVKFLVVHADSGDKLEGEIAMPVVPEKGRPLDKAVSTALTYAEGYYLRGLLCLPRGEAGADVDARDDRNRGGERAARPAAAPQQPSAPPAGERTGPPNKWAGPCHNCGAEVAADAGVRGGVKGAWLVFHKTEAECVGPKPPDPKPDDAPPPPADPPPAAKSAPKGAARAVRNRYAAACKDCGVIVPEGAGSSFTVDGALVTTHSTRAACEAAKRGAGATSQPALPDPRNVELPKGCTWNTEEMPCCDSDCGLQIPPGEGFAHTTKDGKKKAIHPTCYARSKADN